MSLIGWGKTERGHLVISAVHTCLALIGLHLLFTGAEQPQSPTPATSKLASGPLSAPEYGFDEDRSGIRHGALTTVDYNSKSVGTTRHMMVYTPPGYNPHKRYPVLYLLHGIGGTELEWIEHGSPQLILDNLIAARRAVPMIVVFPNGRAELNDRPIGNIFAHGKAFEDFEIDLLNDVIPYIDAHFSTKPDRENRGLAGLSMGGGQALNFGLNHLEEFAWIGGFSSAPNTKPPEKLMSDPARQNAKLRLLWVSCGNEDSLMNISLGVHNYFSSLKVDHVWQVDAGPHDFSVWKADLYHFSQLLFRRKAK